MMRTWDINTESQPVSMFPMKSLVLSSHAWFRSWSTTISTLLHTFPSGPPPPHSMIVTSKSTAVSSSEIARRRKGAELGSTEKWLLKGLIFWITNVNDQQTSHQSIIILNLVSVCMSNTLKPTWILPTVFWMLVYCIPMGKTVKLLLGPVSTEPISF